MRQQYLKNVATLSISDDKCIGCGKCAEVCPHRIFQIRGGKVGITDKNRCMECGSCMMNCPAFALSVQKGVGCASAVIKGWLTKTEPHCDCSG